MSTRAERKPTALRADELIAVPSLVARTFDVAHWRAIHGQLFQDVYDWAGEFRTVDMGKDGNDFVLATELPESSERLLRQINAMEAVVQHGPRDSRRHAERDLRRPQRTMDQ